MTITVIKHEVAGVTGWGWRALSGLLLAAAGCSDGHDTDDVPGSQSEDGASLPAFLGLPPTAADSSNSPLLLSETQAFADLARLEPAPGVLPFSVQSPLWSDGAQKRRWMALPSGSHIGYSEEGPWQFPEGTIFIKHFGIALDERAPDDVQRLETRFLVAAQGGGYYGLVYKWDADQRDARLLLSGAEEVLDVISADGTLRQQRYTYPSQSNCPACHSDRAGYVMGARTAQLDGEYRVGAGEPAPSGNIAGENQLAVWAELNVFDSQIVEETAAHQRLVPLADEAAPVEARVRSYWDSNCSGCHNQALPSIAWDARFSTPLDAQGVLLAEPYSGQAHSAQLSPGAPAQDVRLIVPGDAERSLIYLRSLSDQSTLRMPPLLSNRVDEHYIELLRAWIESLPAP